MNVVNVNVKGDVNGDVISHVDEGSRENTRPRRRAHTGHEDERRGESSHHAPTIRTTELLPSAPMSFRLRSSFVLLLACGAEPAASDPEPGADPGPTPTAMTESPTPTPARAPPADSEYGRIYQLRDDQELRVELQRALAAAREKDGKLLVVFGAEWCPDCRQVAKLLTESPARDVVSEGYEVVHVNIGRRDRHRDLLDRYRVDRISTLVVLDGMARRVAQTTLEPISNRTGRRTSRTRA